jgi:hypothetical protein
MTEDDVDWKRFAQQMASMARNLLAQDSVNAALEWITASATRPGSLSGRDGTALVRS